MLTSHLLEERLSSFQFLFILNDLKICMSLTPCTEVGENKVWEGEDSLPSLTFVSSGNWWRSRRASVRCVRRRAPGAVGSRRRRGQRRSHTQSHPRLQKPRCRSTAARPADGNVK